MYIPRDAIRQNFMAKERINHIQNNLLDEYTMGNTLDIAVISRPISEQRGKTLMQKW